VACGFLDRQASSSLNTLERIYFTTSKNGSYTERDSKVGFHAAESQLLSLVRYKWGLTIWLRIVWYYYISEYLGEDSCRY
jgi:hypothetical protein